MFSEFDYYYPPIRDVPETPDSNSKLDEDSGNKEVRSEAEWDSEPDPLSGRHEFVDSTSCARLR